MAVFIDIDSPYMNSFTVIMVLFTSVVRLTLLYVISEAVIPPRIMYGINSSGNRVQKQWIPGQARNDKQSKGPFEAVH